MPKQYDKYKNSNVIWFGEIPHEWSLAKLAWCVNFINGYSFDSELMDIDKEIPVIRIGDIQNNKVNYETCLKVSINEKNLSLYEIRNNDILIAMSGATTGKLAIISSNTKAYINQRVGIIRTRFNRFIRYCLDNESFIQYINLLSAGSAQPNISRGNILDYKIPYIKFAEQQQIADYLDKKCTEIDRIVETQKNIIEKLKEYKQAVITEAVTKGLDKSVRLKYSGIEWIGKIPEHWKITQVSKLYNVTLGKMLCTAPLCDTDTLENYLCSANIKFEGINTHEIKKMFFTQTEKSLYLLSDGDIVISEGGDAGTASIYRGEASPCYIQNAVHKVSAQNKTMFNKFLYYWIFFCKKVGYIDFICNKATIMHYTKEKVSKTPLPFLSKEEQNQICNYLDKKCSEIDTTISEKEQLIEKLTEYKKSLIYECVTGKRKV